MKEPRPSPDYVPGTNIAVPLAIRQNTEAIVGAAPPGHGIIVVAQALHDGNQNVVRGAVYWKPDDEFTFVGYVSHNLQPHGLTVGVEARWAPGWAK